MKKLLLAALFTGISVVLLAQNNVGIGTNTPNANAKLEIASTTKGLLIPRMTTTQRITFAGTLGLTDEGMMVYDTDLQKFFYWDKNIGFSGNWNQVRPGSLSDGKIWIGDATNTAVERSITGDITMSDTGLSAIQPNAVQGTDISLAGETNGNVMQFNGTDWVTVDPNTLAVSNIYSADGSLTGNRTVSMGVNNLNFTSTTGGFKITTSNGGMTMGIGSTAINTSAAFGANNTSSGGASFTTGTLNTASGSYSMAVGGQQNTASGYGSFATGVGNFASGGWGFVVGKQNYATAERSFASGEYTVASGLNSSVFGMQQGAYSFGEHVVGIWGTPYTPTSTSAYSATDRVFNVGNGSSSSAPSDAFTILKNGNTGIGISNPTNKLEVVGKTKTDSFQLTTGATNNYILRSDASGNGTWVNPNTLGVTNTLTNPVNTITSTVNGVSATAPAVNSVSNTSSANTMSTTINGVAGATVPIINTNTLTVSAGALTSTVNGVASSPAIDLNASLIKRDIVNASGGALSITNGTAQLVGATNATLDVLTNTQTQKGIVTAPGASANKDVWGTDATGNPAWRDATNMNNVQNGINLNTSAPNATATDPYIELGGSLVRPTTITTPTTNNLTITNSGTANTIINLSSTGDLDIQDNGTSALFVRDDANVGVGTNAPASKLHVNSTATATGDIFLMQTPGLLANNATYMKLGRNLANGNTADIVFHYVGDNNNDNRLGFGFFGTPMRMLLTNDGRLSVKNGVADSSSQFEVDATNRGILIPRVALTATNAAGPITLPATSLMVYNTATAGTSPNNVVPGYYYNSGSTAAPVWRRMATGNSDAWTILGNSNTTSPAAPTTYGSTAIGAAENFIGTRNNVSLVLGTNNLERMRILSSGNVGIGTASPTNPLHIQHNFVGGGILNSGNGGNAPGYILADNGTSRGTFGLSNGPGNYILGSVNGDICLRAEGTTNSMLFSTGGGTFTPRMAINSNGNVGIGTITPNAPLQFANTTVNRKIVLWETANNDHQYYGFGVNGNTLRYQVDGTTSNHIFYAAASAAASNELMRIQGNGNVGIGSAIPDNRLTVDAGAATAATANTYQFGIRRAGTTELTMGSDASLTYLQSWNSRPLLINGQGNNVGIGLTTTPNYKLSVNGTIEAIDFGAAGSQNIRIGDDAFLTDLDLSNTLGVRSTSSAFAHLILGNTNSGLVSGGTENYVHAAGTQTFGNGGQYIFAASQTVAGSTFGETGGFYADGNTAAIWSPGDGNGGQPAALLYFMDEDWWDGTNTNPYDNTALKSYINAAGALVSVSDSSKKQYIKPIQSALNKITHIGGYDYQFKLSPVEIQKGQKPVWSSGVLAQEVEKQIPTAVEKSVDGDYFVNYSAIIPYLIESIKEQQAIIDDLKKRLEAIEQK